MTGVDIRFGPPSATYKAGGRIVDANTGKPVPGAVANYGTRTEGGGSSFTNSREEMAGMTNKRGEFLFQAMRPGKYTAYADVGQDSEYMPFEITDGDVKNVVIKAHRGLTVSLAVRLSKDK